MMVIIWSEDGERTLNKRERESGKELGEQEEKNSEKTRRESWSEGET